MKRVGIISFSHETCGIQQLGCVHLTEKKRGNFYSSSPFSETVFLQTCNRREIIAVNAGKEGMKRFAADTFGLTDEFVDVNSVFYFGSAALRHIAETASGLKSAVIGENEIMGQVKSAFLDAKNNGACGSGMQQVLDLVLRASKKARTDTALSKGPVSAAGVAIELAGRHLFLKGSRALLIGTGKINEITVEKLIKKGAVVSFIAGRNLEKARLMAEKTGAEVFSIDDIGKALTEADLVISATSAPHFVMDMKNCGRLLEDRKNSLLIIDLAVPRDVDPQLRSEKITVLNMDDIKKEADKNTGLRIKEKEKALKIIREVLENEVKNRDQKKRAGFAAGPRNGKSSDTEGSVA
jgi:glutamyl-tRNA reductase